MVKRDFRGHAKFFSQNIVLQARAATRLHTEQSGRLFETFKIKTVAVNSKHNFLSDTSLRSLCRQSRQSLKDLCIRNGPWLSNDAIVSSISMLNSLIKLDLSYCKQVNDAAIRSLAIAVPNLKNLSLRFLGELTGEGLKSVLEHQKGLEGLDLSGCFAIDLSALNKLRGNTTLRCLLLEYLQVNTDNIKSLQDSKITTLSVFCKFITTQL